MVLEVQSTLDHGIRGFVLPERIATQDSDEPLRKLFESFCEMFDVFASFGKSF